MIAVIGDIHGCFYTLIELLKKIRKKYKSVEIYCVGDMVDRGNFSFNVVDLMMKEGIRVTPGNHDYMFNHFFRQPMSLFARSWSMNGSETTILSYEGYENQLETHLNYIESLPLFYNLEGIFISHAGISTKYSNELSANYRENLDNLHDLIHTDYLTERGVLWTRDDLLNLGKIQIVGHTTHDEIAFDEEANALYLVTGACIGRKLSSVVIDGGEIIDTIAENTHINDII